MVLTGHGRRAVDWLVGGALVMALAGVTGCSGDTDSAADKKPAAGSSAPAGSGEPEKGEQESGAPAPRSSAADQATAEGAVAAWVAAVIKGDAEEACLLMGEAATGASPAKAGSPSTCGSDAPRAKQMEKAVGSFRESFTPEPPTDDPKVEAAQVPATGDEVVIPADRITVDGKTLEEVILSNSTGVSREDLNVNVEAGKIEDTWYVTNLDFDIG
ncbi:hypothetical protein [Streptomyces prasinopilosus]|uniref:Uncharacterized protein n=1 Tax=Streptomyces prasinopilosus TaxID=67344 RepID=A0A1G6NDY3_9ACTN|nr:hypothetical protein [Streptomyces prasinopilosus]SDC65664.1 hypothetical protein SAMN05216505_10362 [Streptomyces prasinopilosus]